MTDLIVRKRRGNGHADTNDEVWPDLRRITSDEFGIDADELNPRYQVCRGSELLMAIQLAG